MVLGLRPKTINVNKLSSIKARPFLKVGIEFDFKFCDLWKSSLLLKLGVDLSFLVIFFNARQRIRFHDLWPWASPKAINVNKLSSIKARPFLMVGIEFDFKFCDLWKRSLLLKLGVDLSFLVIFFNARQRIRFHDLWPWASPKAINVNKLSSIKARPFLMVGIEFDFKFCDLWKRSLLLKLGVDLTFPVTFF